MAKKKGYIIWAPNYAKSSAGVRCMYILCDRLNKLGYESYVMMSTYTSKDLIAPIMPIRKAQKLLAKGHYIAVYPEIVPSNPLAAKYVARWVLNKPGLLGGATHYDKNEMIFYYSDVYKDYISGKISGKIFIPTPNEELFYDDDRPYENRKLQAYYVGKSVYQDGYFDESSTLEITRNFPARESLGDIFRNCSVLYCFDNSTILAYEAIMCGCPVVVIPDGTQTKADYEKLELGMNGISWGPDELPQAIKTVGGIKETLKNARDKLNKDLDNFVEKTQNWPPLLEYDTKNPLYTRRLQLQRECIELYASIPYNILKKIKTMAPTIDTSLRKIIKIFGFRK